MPWTTVVKPKGAQYVRIRPPGFRDAGHETAPHLFCTTDAWLHVIAMWMWTDAGRPEHLPLTIDTFELARDAALISLDGEYGYERLESDLATAGYRPCMQHTPGEAPKGDNRVPAAWMSARELPGVDGWHEAPEACSCIEEVLLVRGTLRLVSTRETTMDAMMSA
jgi:hypothetical protein